MVAFKNISFNGPPPPNVLEENAEEKIKRKQVLRYLIFCPEFIEATGRVVQETKFFEPFDELNFIWGSVYAFFERFNKPITLSALKLDLECKFTSGGYTFTLKDVYAYLENWFANPDYDFHHVQPILQAHVKAYRLEELQKKIAVNPEEISSDSLKSLADSLTPNIRKPVAKNPFGPDAFKYFEESKPIPLGIDFLDKMLGGGTIPGETVAFIMPPGAGKTTIALQGAAECIKRKKHVCVMSFEQSLSGDLAKRMYILATNSSRSAWKNVDLKTAPPYLQNKWKEAAKDWSTYLHFHDDWTDSDFQLTSVREMFKVIEDLDRIGQKPEVLFIDWWGRIHPKLEETHPHLRSDYEKRQAHQKWLHDIKTYSEKLKLRTFVFHQLSGEKAAKKSWTIVGSAHDAMENRNFPQIFDYCFVTGIKDLKSEKVRFVLSKARSASTKNSQMDVRLDGEHCRFVPADPDYQSTLMMEMIDDDNDEDVYESASSDFQ